jgi:sugar lactone lactonase YvrE
MYYCVVSGRYLNSVPAAMLRSQDPTSELLTSGAVQILMQKGVSDGLKSDSNDIVYAGNFEANSIVTFNQANGTVQTFVRGPRLDWTDTMSVSTDGYLYFTENQLFNAPNQQGGVDKKVKPYKLYRVPLPNGRKKIMLLERSTPTSLGAPKLAVGKVPLGSTALPVSRIRSRSAGSITTL